MSSFPHLRFKIASEDWEFRQIHELNYQTFVEEIPQHEKNSHRILIDKFHEENTYIVCLSGDRVVGMMAIRSRRPFSLDLKLPDLDSHLPPGRSVCEVRLLAVEKGYRNGRVFFGMTKTLVEYGLSQGYDLAVISGTTQQEKLYRHIGFQAFGPLVGKEGAWFQPMYLTLEDVARKTKNLVPAAVYASPPPESFLPGPVAISEEVREVLGESPVSHRSRAFMRDFQELKRRLCRLARATRVEVLVGSGTLANDVVAGQLSLLSGSGIILSNGEFGTRLVDHAARFGLTFRVVQKEWGERFSRDEIVRAIKGNPGTMWIWGVHCETSTTILNDLLLLKEIAAKLGVRLCMDCISTVGTVQVDLAGVYLASCVSGKGLGSFPGLSMVFYDHEVLPSKALPRYLDLGAYAANDGVPYTHSSNLVYALKRALDRFSTVEPFERMRELSLWLRSELRGMGFSLLGSDEMASPAIVTIVLPDDMNSENIGDRLEDAGYLISYRSGYLLKRNWIQICLMGESSRERLMPLLSKLREVGAPHSMRTKGLNTPQLSKTVPAAVGRGKH